MKNISWQKTIINKRHRQRLHGHKSFVLWFTGLSGSGKSTLANKVEAKMNSMQVSTYLLDGDNLRHGLNKDLGFSKKDRKENIRRIGEVAKLFVDAGLAVIASSISPFAKDREAVRNLFPNGEFIEIYTECSLKECERRDPKNLYKKARNGEISHFTGISSPYEPPEHPEIIVNTEEMTIGQCVNKIITYLMRKGYI
ncbi:adenylyl-sulfate kinase [Fictibacillus sp. Mic-4]|uniref:adenylyl-sulfate kinase n=1 Tax=Fictibacillus sp. Mic-4 TaxID=3132826 RepID=UPI003CF7DA18